jgi:hypothetical protein
MAADAPPEHVGVTLSAVVRSLRHRISRCRDQARWPKAHPLSPTCGFFEYRRGQPSTLFHILQTPIVVFVPVPHATASEPLPLPQNALQQPYLLYAKFKVAISTIADQHRLDLQDNQAGDCSHDSYTR